MKQMTTDQCSEFARKVREVRANDSFGNAVRAAEKATGFTYGEFIVSCDFNNDDHSELA